MEEYHNDKNVPCTAMANWSKHEKILLLEALQLHNFQDTTKIHQIIKTKSVKEVQNAIDYYKQELLNNPAHHQKLKKDKTWKGRNLIPLVSWAKFLINLWEFKKLYADTPTAVSVIANYEDFPHAVCTNNIDFKKIYNTIASVLDGKAVSCDKYIFSVIDKCLLDTALNSKGFIRRSSFNNIIKSFNMSDKAVIAFPRPTENHELAILRHLASQSMYNPFNISEDFLKPC